MFDPLIEGKNPNCRVKIVDDYEKPGYFNISAANNLGAYHSAGKYVMFANADVIYPGHFLKRAMPELFKKDVCYAVAARVYLSPEQSDKLHEKKPTEYTTADRFNSLMGLERTGIQIAPALSPWMFRRDVIHDIGGFDPRILFAEDRDMDYRVMHYLRRKGWQNAIIAFPDLYGYHQHHASTGLFNNFFEAKEILESRARRMEADPNNTEDCVPTNMDDLAALKRDMMQTKPPPPLEQYRKDLPGKVKRRARKVWQALVHGT
jgi:GT2 family glycosyltransferase